MNCPCCNKPLHTGFDIKENSFVAWCGNGECKSYKANDGAFGKTKESALKNLVDKLNEKPDWK
jgi:hypothetical protein